MQSETPQALSQVNNAVACDVNSCAYHNGNKGCSAAKIHVNSVGCAHKNEETACRTFVPAE